MAHPREDATLTAYNLETLGDERFQQMCQAILTSAHPNMQCLPVGQRDGGRDGFSKRQNSDKAEPHIIFQVKYIKDPSSRDARDFIESVIKTEKEKVERLIARGTKAYYLLTNVYGTSHLDAGSIDKVDTLLSKTFGIDAYCWWRDDIERRIDAQSSIKWSYPDILRATDLLQALIDGGMQSDATRRIKAIRSYMAYQARADEQLKFKQIDLQKNIIDLFVDVPAHVVSLPGADGRARWANDADYDGPNLMTTSPNWIANADLTDRQLARSPGAMRLLSNSSFLNRFPKIVIEGAPGQGKSTITQYLCQLHRLLLLDRRSEFERADDAHRPTEAKVPFRVDLRDYALWINGRDPFSDDPNARLPSGTNPILESFLAAQVKRYTGFEFAVHDLTSVTSIAQIIIILDGFDEVADVPSRNRIVSEVSDAAVRIQQNALSSQIIVTSRPAAFANSPGFPKEEWQHVQILSLSRSAIHSYATKWLDGRNADQKEKLTVLHVLEEKLQQAYVRDLARNPMQLAILLALISVQGASLPDKRTFLYDKYIDIFLNREAEKSPVVRDHRDLLIQLQQFLAWTLQTQAETELGSGHIMEATLRATVNRFLKQSGHPEGLTDQLFSGMVERVGVLVSRIKGTYEFEVQPLREYFTARYLRDTAPYDPTGTSFRGTLPERFDAIARNFYWLNVARFYAGCYASGELASLLFGLDEISKSEPFRYISHVPQLGFTLLSDYVFSQQPRLATSLVTQITGGPGFRLLLASRFHDSFESPITLPDSLARTALTDVCKALLRRSKQTDTNSTLCGILTANCEQEDLLSYWHSVRHDYGDDLWWFEVGYGLNIFAELPLLDINVLFSKNRNSLTKELLRCRRLDVLDADIERWALLRDDMLNGFGSTYMFYLSGLSEASKRAVQLSLLSIIFSSFFCEELENASNQSTVSEFITRIGVSGITEARLLQTLSEISDAELVVPRSFLNKMREFSTISFGILKSNIDLWSDLIEEGRVIWGQRWAFCCLATSVTAMCVREKSVDRSSVGRESTLCGRATRAFQAEDDHHWWLNELASVKSQDSLGQKTFLLFAYKFASPDIIMGLADDLTGLLDGLSDLDWSELVEATSAYPSRRLSGSVKGSQKAITYSLPAFMSPRLACLLISLLDEQGAAAIQDKYLGEYEGDDPAVLSSNIGLMIERAVDEPGRWAITLSGISHAYHNNVVAPEAYYIRHNRPDQPGRNLPNDEALKVCANAESYPLMLVNAAENVLASQTGSRAKAVGKIAIENGWFMDTESGLT